MNHQPNIQPNLNISPVRGELLPRPSDSDASLSPNPENLPNPEITPSQAPQVSLPVNPTISDFPFDNNSVQSVPIQDNQTIQPIIPVHPIERDLIGKEWIIRAKQITAQNRDDPYRQSIEFTKLKAEYIKQRYNLTLKSN